MLHLELKVCPEIPSFTYWIPNKEWRYRFPGNCLHHRWSTIKPVLLVNAQDPPSSITYLLVTLISHLTLSQTANGESWLLQTSHS